MLVDTNDRRLSVNSMGYIDCCVVFVLCVVSCCFFFFLRVFLTNKDPEAVQWNSSVQLDYEPSDLLQGISYKIGICNTFILKSVASQMIMS